MSRTIILASQSLQRRELLSSLGFEFLVVPADIDELAISDPDHAVRAAKVAAAKALKISQQYPQAVIIAADTFLVLDDKRLEKPLDRDEARSMLHQMSGKTVTVFTGWAVFDPEHQLQVSQANVDEVTFRNLSAAEIEKYVSTYPVTKWAGAFTLSHMPGMALIADIQGSLTSILGLPIEKILPYLSQAGIAI